MVRVTPESIRKKRYSAAADRVAPRYTEGVQAASGVIEAAIRGQTRYVEMMTNAEVLARREAGLRKSSDAEWKAGALKKGAVRIGPGMKAAVDKQARGYAPIASALEGLTVPDAVADFRTNVANRLIPVVETQKRAAGKL